MRVTTASGKVKVQRMATPRHGIAAPQHVLPGTRRRSPPAQPAVRPPVRPPARPAAQVDHFDRQSGGNVTNALTYDNAKRICSGKGQRICSIQDLCPSGRPRSNLDKFGNTDNWIAVNNAENEWLTFNRAGNRLCKSHTQVAGQKPAWGTQPDARGFGFTRAVKCCPK